jgi:hypothetical protein
MARIAYAVAVCTVLAACAAGPTHKPSESVPPELVPSGFTAADCRITEPGGPITEIGPDGRPMTRGTRQPKVECTKHIAGAITVKSTPTCHTKGGKELLLADCCMNEDGSTIPACTPKVQPAGE